LNDFKTDEDFVFDEPGTNISGVKKESELTKEDAQRLNDSLYYSDIVITLGSTIAIDAAVFNKPNIIFSFNVKEKNSDDIKKFSEYAHLKKFFGFGSCRIAKSRQELAEQINNYFDDPALDTDKRKAVVDEYCYKLDGKSSSRVAQFILDYVK
jgi:CDP-glycerol glycerophosphotransferase (TagB/SpsB family)